MCESCLIVDSKAQGKKAMGLEGVNKRSSPRCSVHMYAVFFLSEFCEAIDFEMN